MANVIDRDDGNATVAPNATEATPVPDTNVTAVVPTSGDNSTSNENVTVAPVTVAPVTVAPVTAAPVPTQPPEPKEVNLTMSIKIDAVTPDECKSVVAAENPKTTEVPPVTTPAPTLPPNTTEAEGNVTVAPVVTVPTSAPDANATDTPAANDTDTPISRRRRAAEFNAETFVEAAEAEFKKLIEKAGGKNVTVTINRKEISCGSIDFKKVETNGEITRTVDEFKEELKKQTAAGITIQGKEVTKEELEKAAESVSEATGDKTDKTPVTTAGLTGGAIAGIVIGVILGAILIAFVVLHLMKKQQKQAAISSNSRVKLSEVQDGR